MSEYPGKNSNGKIIKYNLRPNEGTEGLYALTRRQTAALLSSILPLDWMKRHNSLPSDLDTQDKLSAWADELRLRLMQMVDFCEQMINCIENDEDVIEALNNVYNQFDRGKKMPPSELTRGLGGTVEDCDPDILFGMCSELIEQMHNNNIDFNEVMETLSNSIERIAAIIAAIPVFETLPVDDAFNFVQGVLTDDIFEAYLANDTTTYRNELKCDIFCLARDNNCTITFDMLISVFTARIGYVGIDDFASIINFISSGTWVGTQVNDLFYLLQLAAMKFGNQFFEIIGLKMFDFYAKLGANNPSSDWELLCDICSGDFCHTWDMTESGHGWNILFPHGEFIPGTGIGANGSTVIWLYREDFAGSKIKYVKIKCTSNIQALQIGSPYDTLAAFAFQSGTPPEIEIDVSGNPAFNSVNSLAVRGTIEGLTVITGIISEITVCYFGDYIDFDTV